MNDKLKMLIIENNKETLSNMQIKKNTSVGVCI